ncbi:MAG: hypothetical protein JXC85_02910 [Candidatus Aenigmarchaeota archaeon]|nr:hypothetical protein [Candidatus Aenigmarchaeota archaeon]
MDWQRLLFDFMIGGGLIAAVVSVFHFVSPLIGGIIAAVPVRIGITMFLGGIAEGSGFVLGMLRGSIPGSFGAFSFMFVLSRATRRLGIWRSFSIATLVCVLVVCIGLVMQ